MAGIGFELRKIVRRGDPLSFVQMALSGAVVVAGPWLITVAALGVLQKFADFLPSSRQEIFIATLVYVYAVSLMLFGGSHYLFSRIVADLLYEKKEGLSLSYLLWFSGLVGLVSALVSGVSVCLLPFAGEAQAWTYRVAAVLFFVLVSIHWLFLLHLSLLKWYGRIFLVYLAGMAISLAAAFSLSPDLGLGGVILGFDLGQAFILVAVFILVLQAYPAPEIKQTFRGASKVAAGYLRKNIWLVLAGAAYYFAMWADKVIYWIFLGQAVEGTPFQLSPDYDRLVYFANLAMIPGLVYFVVFSETEFYLALRRFLKNLNKKRYRFLFDLKKKVLGTATEALTGLAVFQAAIMGFLMLLIPLGVERGFLSPGLTPYLLLAAVFFHLVFFRAHELSFLHRILFERFLGGPALFPGESRGGTDFDRGWPAQGFELSSRFGRSLRLQPPCVLSLPFEPGSPNLRSGLGGGLTPAGSLEWTAEERK